MGPGIKPETSTPRTLAESQIPPEQAANGPTPSQPFSILYTRQQAETPMSPSVTFTEPSTSACINPNDHLRFETNDVHIVQSVHPRTQIQKTMITKFC